MPGTYILVDHSLSRAFNKGALGMLKVTGAENKLVYSGKISDEVYLPEGTRIRMAEAAAGCRSPGQDEEGAARTG